jgi:uncharacterized protein DUF3160
MIAALRVLLAVVLLTGIVPTAFGFDPAAYQDFLNAHQNLTTEALLNGHAPFGPYSGDVPAAFNAEYLDSLSALFGLTPQEHDLLLQHGFMVTERQTFDSYGTMLHILWRHDMPLFITTDSILHALHRSYDNLLVLVESQYIATELGKALDELAAAWPTLWTRYPYPQMIVHINDLDVYLTVARSLLSGATVPSQGGNDAVVNEILTRVDGLQPSSYPLFNDTPRLVDWSQFEPRGHYADSETLSRYFRAMMWLGRTEFRLTIPPGENAPASVDREIMDAFLLSELVSGNAAEARLASIDGIIGSLVGPSDNVTLPEMARLKEAAQVQSSDQLLDSAVMQRAKAELATGNYSAQSILSQILIQDPLNPQSLDPPYAFLLMGQRFLLDSYVMGQVVYDRIHFEGGTIFRELPSPLDVLYALGNDDVLPLLRPELDAYHYGTNLEALRYLVDAYDPSFWKGSLYNVWLAAIRTLSQSGRAEGVPAFMKTGAWQQEKMTTQLASWAELRHDNLLYGKQSYTGGFTCTYPSVYVEPIPDFYARLYEFAETAGPLLSSVPLSTYYHSKIMTYFSHMADTMGKLEAIARKELDDVPLTSDEETFLRSTLCLGSGGCASVENGWYRDLYFDTGDYPTLVQNMVIADVHTAPTDASGAMVGHVLHVGTSKPKLGIFLAMLPGGTLTAYAGAVASFHEYVTVGFKRLTDAEWKTTVQQSPPLAPEWAHAYLADAQGNAYPPGPAVVEESPHMRHLQLPARLPNPDIQLTAVPEAGGVLLSFSIPIQEKTTLRIYNAEGRLVRRLLDEDLRGGNYRVRWDGADDRSVRTGAGIYFGRLSVGEKTAVSRLLLLPSRR